MSRIFISHSSRDNFEALAFKNWLVGEGWPPDDVFLDLHGIGAGESWKEALARANERCEAVVLLASPESLKSTECRIEIRMAEDYGKEIIVAILYLLKIESDELGVYRERQIVDLSQEPREASFTVEHQGQRRTVTFNRPTLARIKARLDQLGISPTSFIWRPGDLGEASPYPGFGGFGEREAALFFGRAADIARGFAELRKLRRAGTGQILVVQAASGAGKSSFLRAGLWQRLQRDPDFTPVAILRPATGILTGETGMGRQLAAFFAASGRPKTAVQVHRVLTADDTQAAATLVSLINEATEIGHAAQRLANQDAPPPTPVIAVDQAEELFAADDAEESGRFLRLVARSLQHGPGAGYLAPPIFIWTIRADSVDALLHATEMAGLKPPAPFLLPPIPRDAYREIIEAPLAVANQAGMRLSIEPLLVSELVARSEGADALPLLAYTLRQLLADNRSGGAATLTLSQYEAAGGIGGVLSKRLALAQRDAQAGPDKLRRLFIPRLATWDAESTPPGAKRLVAADAELFAGDRASLKPLADALVEGHLLSRAGGEARATTLEVAHEALLRQPPLSEWLEESREFLVWRDAVARARRGFEGNARPHLIGRELEIGRGWLGSPMGGDVAPEDRAFIAASVAAEERQRNEEAERERQRQQAELDTVRAREETARERAEASRRVARRTMAGMLAALLLAVGAGGIGWYAREKQHLAEALAEDARRAEQRAKDAAAKASEAEKRAAAERDAARITQSRFLSDLSAQHLERGDAGTAILLALAGLRDRALGLDGNPISVRPHVPEAEARLLTGSRQLHERRVFNGHTDMVWRAAFSPNGARVVTASDDRTARLWDTASGKALATLEGHTSPVTGVAFSPDGAHVVTASEDRTARLWDAAGGKALATLEGHTSPVTGVAFSPDGARVVTASDDSTARLWDTASGKALAILVGHKSPVRSATFSPDGARVVTASWDGTARLWDAASGKALATLVGHTDRVWSAAFSPDGARVVTASNDRTARLWDAASGKALATLVGHTDRVWSAAFSPDGARVVTASDDRTARLWDAASGKALATLEGHTSPVRSAAFSPGGARVVTASRDRTARLWDAAGGKALATLVGHTSPVRSTVFSPDGAHILTASEDGTARLWDAAGGKAPAILQGHTGEVTSAAFSRDGGRVVTASEDGTARLWDAAGGKALTTLGGHAGLVVSAAFSPDGTRILTASSDKTVRLWDAASGKALATLKGHKGGVTSAAFSPDGARVLTASLDGTARQWDTASGKALATLVRHTDAVVSAAFSPDGARVLTASKDGTARLWDAAGGKTLATLKGHKGWVMGVAFSPDGACVLTASKDKTARLWDSASGKALATLKGHTGEVTSAAFSPDGARVLTASLDGTARLWDTASGKALATLVGHTDAVVSAAFSPDGARVLTASWDGTARLWEVFPTPQALVDHAKRVVPRCLTRAQLRQSYLSEEPPRWCITGAGLEAERDSKKWQPLWPYHSTAWRDWLAARDRGESPELPTMSR